MSKDSPKDTDAPKVYRHDDELELWRKEYEEVKALIAADLKPLEDIPLATGGAERREEPRYNFMPDSLIYAHMGPRAFKILNISVGGLAFYSDLAFAPGTKLLMSALGMIALDVEVLFCDMEETDSDLMEYRYRIRAQFGAHVNGYQVYVLAREMHLQQMKEGQDSPTLTASPQ